MLFSGTAGECEKRLSFYPFLSRFFRDSSRLLFAKANRKTSFDFFIKVWSGWQCRWFLGGHAGTAPTAGMTGSRWFFGYRYRCLGFPLIIMFVKLFEF